MRYTQLRAFHNVALHGGFSRAAAALNQSQPSLSDQVRKLEQAHDVLLFHRDARQVRLTQAGEELFRLTSQFFEQETRIGEFLDSSRAEVTGTLRIVADSALHITAAVGQFRAQYPGVFVTLHTGNTPEAADCALEKRERVHARSADKSSPAVPSILFRPCFFVAMSLRPSGRRVSERENCPAAAPPPP